MLSRMFSPYQTLIARRFYSSAFQRPDVCPCGPKAVSSELLKDRLWQPNEDSVCSYPRYWQNKTTECWEGECALQRALQRKIREDSERIRDIFKKANPQQNLLQPRLDYEFRERVFKLMTGGLSVGEFSPDEKRALEAFVSFDDDFHEKARLLIASKKSIKEFSPEEKRIMEFYVNFDKEFKECVAKVLWNDFPRNDVDPIRFLFVNFDKDFKIKITPLIRSYNSTVFKEEEARMLFLFVNYNQEFLDQTLPLIRGAKSLDQLSKDEKSCFEVYVNLNNAFEDQVKSLMNDFRTLNDLSDDERRLISLYVNHHRIFRKQMAERVNDAHYVHYGEDEKRMYRAMYTFSEPFRDKTHVLMWRRRDFSELSLNEQIEVAWYINCIDKFKRSASGNTPAFTANHFQNLWGSKQELRYFENFAMCNRDFLRKVEQLIFGEKQIAEFTREECEMMEFYVYYNHDFQKGVNTLLTKSFEQLTPAEKRIFNLHFRFNKSFRARIEDLIWSIKRLDDFTPEEKQLASLYVNLDKAFKTLASNIYSSKKEYHDFSLKEERIVDLYANFDVNFLAQARQLVEQHHKKGGFYDHDCKFRYHDTNPHHITPRPKSPIKENFTPEEENTIKLYVNFNLEFRNELNKTLRNDRPRTKEADRIFFLGMWYDKDLRVLINSTIWDKTASEKISEGSTRKHWLIRYEYILDSARRKDAIFSKEDELYYYLGNYYYDIPHKF